VSTPLREAQKRRIRSSFPETPPKQQRRTISIYLDPRVARALDAYVASLPDPKPSNRDISRTAIEEWLAKRGFLPSDDRGK
jgi:hypothetical protein